MTEIVRIMKIDFDTMENSPSDAIRVKCLGSFMEGDGLSAHGKASKWISEQPPVRIYLAYDGDFYPMFRLDTEYVQ